MMKKQAMILLGLLLVVTAVVAGSDEVQISAHRLPENARTLMKRCFGDIAVSRVVMEEGLVPTYEATLVDGTTLDFDSRGNWTDIECTQGSVPDDVVPVQIARFLTANYPNQTVRGIERDGRTHELRLDDGLELTFNRRFKLIATDR